MQQLHVFTKQNPPEIETWEIGMIETDPEGRKIVPCLGVRCKGGAWIKADILERAIANERAEGAYRSSDC